MLALCGKSVGTSRRTSFPGEITEWSEQHCKTAGKPAINVVGTEGSPDARTQLKQGRVDAAMQGNETLPYVMKLEPDTYAVVGERISSQLTGIGVAKSATELQQALAEALRQLVADGSYKKILDKWGLSADAVEEVTINAGN
jgi:polar amino acid transport system substrate-binding protein